MEDCKGLKIKGRMEVNSRKHKWRRKSQLHQMYIEKEMYKENTSQFNYSLCNDNDAGLTALKDGGKMCSRIRKK